MGATAIAQGPTARTVADNIRRLMKARSMTGAELSSALGEVGRPILATGIAKILSGDRRVDVDDLMALAIALRVNPNALLFPSTMGKGERYDVTGASGLSPHQLWNWADGDEPLVVPADDDGEAHADFQTHAKPRGRRGYRPWQPAGDEAFRRDAPAIWAGETEPEPPRRSPAEEARQLAWEAEHERGGK